MPSSLPVPSGWISAEREGFEPSDPVSQVNSLAVSPIRPLSHLSKRSDLLFYRLGTFVPSVHPYSFPTMVADRVTVEGRTMKGTMRERTPGVWEVRAYTGRDGHGRPVQVSRTVHGGKRAAQAVLTKLVAEVDANGAPLSGAETVAELLDRWLEHVTPLREPGTIRGYASTIRRIEPVLGHVKVAKLTAQHLDRAYRDWLGRGLSPATVRHSHAVLSAALHQALRWGVIAQAVTDRASVPSVDTTEQTPVTPEDLQRLITAADADSPILAAAIALAAVTGARREELCGLRWRDLDSDGVLTIRRAVKHDVDRTKLVVRTTKTRQIRRVALDDLALALLQRHRTRVEQWAEQAEVDLDDEAYILPGGRPLDPTGRTPVKPDTLTEQFRRLAHKVGVQVRFHDLRHFSATQLIGAGVDVRTVAGRLGHADASTTLRTYSHQIEERDREAAAILGRLVAPRAELPPVAEEAR